MGKLIRIVAPYFVAGIEIDGALGCYDGYADEPVTINRTAPILRYMRGWSDFKIKRHCRIKGWGYQEGISL